MKTSSLFSLIVATCTLCAACSTTRMQSPHQHEHLEVTASAALDLPGYFFIPRFDLQGTLGLFDIMDVSAHAGTALFVDYTAGLGVRFYPASWVTLGGAIDYSRDIYDDFDPNQSIGQTFDIVNGNTNLVFITSRAAFNYNADRFILSGGPQAMLMAGTDYTYNARTDLYEEDGVAASAGALGAFITTEFDLGKAGAIQTELSLWPAWIDTGFGAPPSPFNAANRSAQLGIAYNYHFRGFVESNDPEEDNKRAAPSEPEPSPAAAPKTKPPTPKPAVKPPAAPAPQDPEPVEEPEAPETPEAPEVPEDPQLPAAPPEAAP